MDRFGYTLLPAAAEAGLDTTLLCRLMPLFRRVVAREETTVVIAPCVGSHRLTDGGLYLLLTDTHLVITQRSRPLHHLRLHLHAVVYELADVQVAAQPDGVELRFRTASRPAEHHFLVRPGYPADVDRLTAALRSGLVRGGLVRGGLVPGADQPAAPVPAGAVPVPAGLPRPEHRSLASYWSVQPVRHAPPVDPAQVRAGHHVRRNH